jgi:hypothetical protein
VSALKIGEDLGEFLTGGWYHKPLCRALNLSVGIGRNCRLDELIDQPAHVVAGYGVRYELAHECRAGRSISRCGRPLDCLGERRRVAIRPAVVEYPELLAALSGHVEQPHQLSRACLAARGFGQSVNKLETTPFAVACHSGRGSPDTTAHRHKPHRTDTYALFPITRDVTLAAHQSRFFLRDL